MFAAGKGAGCGGAQVLEGYHCLGDAAAVGPEVAAAFSAAAAAASFKVRTGVRRMRRHNCMLL